ncbi:MAG: hypothetical protein GC178_09220 [Flavobacteriales bacterium]|nr:hypothetical protein [Flavobacteriales bacterium]
MRHTRTVYALTLLLFVVGCGLFKKEEERPVVARAKEHKLYLDELKAVLPANLTPDDSTTFANSFIKNWATQMLLLDKAELNLKEADKDVTKQLEEYRRSLIIYQYENQLIKQRLDTNVTKQQIEEYYNNNKQNFELQDNIARAVFVKLAENSKDVEKVKKLVRSEKTEDREELEEFCTQHAKAFHLNDQQWVPFTELMGLLPKTSYINLNYFSSYNFAYLSDSTAHYMMDVREIKYKNSVSPIEFEEQNIRNIILNQRKLELVQKLERDIFDDAVSKNEFEILNN